MVKYLFYWLYVNLFCIYIPKITTLWEVKSKANSEKMVMNAYEGAFKQIYVDYGAVSKMQSFRVMQLFKPLPLRDVPSEGPLRFWLLCWSPCLAL